MRYLHHCTTIAEYHVAILAVSIELVDVVPVVPKARFS